MPLRWYAASPRTDEDDLLVADPVAAADGVVAVRADPRVERLEPGPRLRDEDDGARRMPHAEVDEGVDDAVRRLGVDDGDDEVEHRRARMREALLGDERIAAVVEAGRGVPQRGEVPGDGAHRGVALLPHRRGQALGLAEAHEPPMDRLLLAGAPHAVGHGRRHARPSRSSSSSAAGGPHEPAA